MSLHFRMPASASVQVRKAGALVARVARNVFVKHMEQVIDEEKAETNATMSEYVSWGSRHCVLLVDLLWNTPPRTLSAGVWSDR